MAEMITTPNPDNPTLSFKMDFDGEEVEIVAEFHISENADEFLDVTHFVTIVGKAAMGAVMEP
jgi:hypothetical protein